MTGQQLRIDGRWASTIASWGDLQWTTQVRGGMHEIAWSMGVDTRFRDRSLRTGALVEVFDGPTRIGAGAMSEPDIASGAFVARGLYRLGENFLALDSGGTPTTVPDDAIDAAIARGLPWKRIASIRSTAYGASPPAEPLKIGALLDGYSDAAATYWTVDADGYVTNNPAPTTPTWYLPPGVTDLGLAEDDYASDLYGRYLTSGGTFATTTRGDAAARAAFERREAYVDETGLGVITPGLAGTILSGLLAKGRARPAFTAGVEVSADQLLTLSGVRADLSMVTAGQIVRSQGLFDDIAVLNGATYLDWLIGETTYVAGASTISLSPAGLAARDLSEVLATLPNLYR